MTHSSRWFLVLGLSVVACGAMTWVYAQDDLEALLLDLGGGAKPAEQAKKPEAEKPAAVEAPAAEAAPAEPMAGQPAVVAEEAPAVVVQPAVEQPVVAAPAEPMAEQPAAEAAPVPAVVAEEAPAAAVPAAEQPAAAEVVAEPMAEAPAADVAQAPVEGAPAVAAKVGGDQETDAIVSELMTLETIRRKSLDDHGYASLETARNAMKAGDFALAREQYKQALEFIGNRPSTLAARQEAKTGIAEAFYRDARAVMKKADAAQALPLAVQAKEFGHPQADRLIEALKREPPKTAADTSSISHRLNEEDYKEQRDDIRRRLRRSRQYFTTAEYDKAQEECELILREYPDNVEAMELRDRIADRMKSVADVEFEATRSMMISDVRKTWTPDRYAIESAQMPKGRAEAMSKTPTGAISDTQTAEQIVRQKLVSIVIPEVTFRPPATIIDAVDFFKQASRDYDQPEIPVEQRGVNLVLKLPASAAAPAAADPADPFAAPSSSGAAGGAPQISALSARFINLFDALKLVCDVTGMKFRIRGNIVMIVPANEPDAELMTRSYNVLSSLTERMTAASSELGGGGGGGGGDNTFMTVSDMGGKQDWKVFFQQMGVQWPEGSSISYMATIGKLRVTNTAEQLAVFEQVLEDLNVTPRQIEIEARFVEVSQKDLNSLGFEWLLNSDYGFNTGGVLGKALGLKDVKTDVSQLSIADYQLKDAAGNPLIGANGQPLYASTANNFYNTSVNAIDGQNYSTGNRYLSTPGNPIAGEGNAINDQFMRVNAFFGSADVSMILHMLSQRSDTDLLSAPKVVTKSGQEAVMKVVTEYIYPTEFEVQISQQTSGGNLTTGGSSEPLAMVEPQNFEMREVGIILQVVPEVTAEGQMINLMLNPQVVSEPVWKNYGTKVPKTTYRAPTALERASNPLATQIAETSYIELPMEQPFFHVRSVQTQLSVYNGATVVMGGLITESRKTMEDKVPFLGDLPYVGRLFRSRSEMSDKRNLLVFVTARLVDPAGRSVRTGSTESSLMSGPAAGGGQQTVTPDVSGN